MRRERPEQIPTSQTTVPEIMRSRAFQQGVADARASRPPRFDLPNDADWDYERGRLFATIAPAEMPIMKNGRLYRPAEVLCRRAFAYKEII
jgi:hypothetical protein